MPIYEYECENQHRFEKWQSIKDDPLTECPDCGKPVRKIFHPAGIIFKGSGWYITDSRKASGAADKAESKTDTGTLAKSESAKTQSAGGETKSKESSSSSENPKNA
ncbi:zinc ribbon domain-containing protein [Anaerolineae bacterium CFX7]|nr:zinc ribbon domain-containing protein [Anaerolineae bacterium CFX7]